MPGLDLAMPIAPQPWHFRQSIEYSITINRAVIDYASRNREALLYNIYGMGKNSIERGSRDTWTPNPRRDAEVAKRVKGPDSVVWAAQHAPEFRDPRGYIIPSDQPDFPTAVKFVNALRETGITVQRATAPFTVGGKRYPAGSLIVPAAQAFRPHVMDMFEPQAHPDVFAYEGAPPTPPYDNAGWTWALQMGVEFDRILDEFSGPFETITEWNIEPPRGTVSDLSGARGFLLTPRANDSFTAVNRLLKAGARVSRLTSAEIAGDLQPAPGTFYVQAGRNTAALLDSLAAPLGISAIGTRAAAPASSRPVRQARVGLWDAYGGSMPSGWTRWILEQFEIPFSRVFAPELNRGKLNAKYDVLLFVDGAIPSASGEERRRRGELEREPPNLPAEYRGQFGRITADTTIPKLREFIANGGTVVAIGSSATNLAAYLGLPIENHLVENGEPLPRTKFYVPGSVLSVRVDTTHAVAYGMPSRVDVFFDDSPVFRLAPGAEAQGVKVIAWFDSKTPLRSGWAWGQEYLENGIAAVEVPLGRGRVVLFGPEILQRAQPHGTFKFLFNALLTMN